MEDEVEEAEGEAELMPHSVEKTENSSKTKTKSRMASVGRGVVTLGTSSPLKLRAVKAVLGSLEGVDIEAIGEFVSPVQPQPVGLSQTELGAQLRAQAAQAQFQARHGSSSIPSLAIGIENGMHFDGAKWIDLAAVVLILNAEGSEHKWLAWSDSIDIPDENIAELKASGDGWDQETQHPTGVVTWSQAKDPHSLINPVRPREAFLAETLTKLLNDHRGDIPPLFIQSIGQAEAQ